MAEKMGTIEDDIATIQWRKPRKRKAVEQESINRGGLKIRGKIGKKTALGRWNYQDKIHLLEAVKNCPIDDYESMMEYVPSKTKQEIEQYMQRLIQQINKTRKGGTPLNEAPIEKWLELCRDLVDGEFSDHSETLARVFSIIANFEKFPEPNETTPDYKAIYKFLANILAGNEPAQLGSLESAVVLDLLHGLAMVLRSCDTSLQQKVLKWKYELFTKKVDPSNYRAVLENRVKAVENDYSEFFRPGEENILKTLQSSNSTSQSASSSGNHGDGPNNSEVASQGHTEETTDSNLGNDGDNQNQSSNISNDTQTRNQGDTTLDTGHPGDESQSGNHGDAASETSDNGETQRVEFTSPAPFRGRGKGRGRGRPRGWGRAGLTPEIKYPKKPKLFTINPFCIPVKLLDLK